MSLQMSPELEYDLTPPPEYANSADIYEADPELEAERNRERYAGREPDIFAEPEPEDLSGYEWLETAGPDTPPPDPRYLGRSRQELANGKCGTCGDQLVKCECVE